MLTYAIFERAVYLSIYIYEKREREFVDFEYFAAVTHNNAEAVYRLLFVGREHHVWLECTPAVEMMQMWSV